MADRPKVTIHQKGETPHGAETPSATITATAARSATTTDARGRKITVRPVDLLEMYRLTTVMGERANVDASLNIALAACRVRDIDGDAIFFPIGHTELEHLMQRLGLDGITAANEATAKLNEQHGGGDGAPK